MIYYQNLLYILEINKIKLKNSYPNSLLVGQFKVRKNYKLIERKYYQLILYQNINKYVKSYDIYLAFKEVRFKR